MRTLEIYDTTLRDGAQTEDLSFTVEDKLRITQRLDALGIHYIEGGWPGANPKDVLYFQEAQSLSLKSAQIVAFGSTRKSRNKVSEDPNIKNLLAAETAVVTLFGKSWDFHVTEALSISLKKNLELISDSIAYLVAKGRRVFYDAEHFFDGYLSNGDYALKTLQAAQRAGAERIILCDTNGGMMPWQIRDIFGGVQSMINTPLGIHTHNDSEMAVANALSAVELGAVQVQGTINGVGERCGNANLCSLLPNLKLKMGIDCIGTEQLKRLREVSRFVSEIANFPPNKYQPYVGDAAFAHKGGIHVHAVRKNAQTYEHVLPEAIGNRQRILVSDYAGQSTLLQKAKEYGMPVPDKAHVQKILSQLKDLEHQGYQFEGAEASFELLMRKAVGIHKRFFDLLGFRVIVEKRSQQEAPISEATIMVRVEDQIEHTAAVGSGPVNALDSALRRALEKFYPTLKHVRLLDYKVRVMSANRGSESRVRVMIESSDRKNKWGTVGVSENLIEASWQALVDSIEYKLLKVDSSSDGGL